MTKIIVSLLAGVTGIAALLAGLGVDAWLHAQDETLAAREGIFTLTNPGHLLLGGGLALTCAGILMALYFAWGMSQAGAILGRRWVRVIGLQAVGAAAVGATVFAVAVSAAGHDHADTDAAAAALHAHGATMAVADMAPASGGFESLAIARPGVTPMQGEAMMSGGDVAAAGAAPADGEMSMAHAHADAGTMPAPAEASDSAVPSDGTMISDDARPDGMLSPDGAAMPAGAHGHPEPTAEERTCLVALTADAKAATARFADIDVARAEGYRISDDPTETHMPNRAYMRDGKTLDLAYPETLVYVMDDSGERRFVGALYKAIKGQGPTPCGAATYWHTHGRCIDAAGAVIAENKDKTCPADYTHREGAVEMMHLWFVPRGQRRA